MKRLIILLHRYVGIPMSVIFIVWFVSGIVMMYTGDMPSLGDPERLRGQGPIDLDAVTLSPAEAARQAGIDSPVSDASMKTLLGRPVYQFTQGFGGSLTVFADSGETFEGVEAGDAQAAAATFVDVPADKLQFVETVSQADQWTLTHASSLPLERFDVDDGRGTRAYFSLRSGSVELITDRKSRALAWAGAIPHWFYFTPLRTNQPVWYWTVVWVSVVGCLLALLGLILAVTQFRRTKPFRLSSSIRYRGWMKWHYYTGALFGLLALTWVFSGLLSMEPFDWQNTEGFRFSLDTLEGGAIELDQYNLNGTALAAALAGTPAYAIELSVMQSTPYLDVLGLAEDGSTTRQFFAAENLTERSTPFSADSILSLVEAAAGDTSIREHTVLDEYDAYYYSRDGQAPLPALRIKFDDPADTWYYIDLATSRTVAAVHRMDRLERWLFSGLHSLDFGFWYGRRPLWDIGVILLSLGALATSSIGMYLGFRRLFGFNRRRGRQAPSL